MQVAAAIQVLLGRAFETMDQRAKAATCYRAAIKSDILCFEAFERLVDGFMQTSADESRMMQELQPLFPKEMPWIEQVYRAKLKRFVDQPLTTKSGLSIEDTYTRIEEAYDLHGNDKLLESKAEALIYCNQHQKAYEITRKALERDPYNFGNLLLVHTSALVGLQLKNELFYLAHKIVEENPKLALGWYIVGCYYYVIKNYPHARRYFHKATMLDKEFGAAWLAFGHVFAAEGEPDQALAAYRTAMHLLIGSHIPPLCMATELIRSNNPSLGLEFALKAYRMRQEDPLILNEFGLCLIKGLQYSKAVDNFTRALEYVGSGDSNLTEFWEPTLFNLAHCYRKLGQYDLAIKYYTKALGLCPSNSSTYTALGLTHHMLGDLDQAIEYYHQALSLQPEDPTFATELLQRALQENFCDVLPISETFAPFLENLPPLDDEDEQLVLQDGSDLILEEDEDGYEDQDQGQGQGRVLSFEGSQIMEDDDV